MVLLALVDADYKFIYVDVGCNGRISDGGVYRNSSLSRALEQNNLNIPGPRCLPNSNKKLPFVVVGDDAFPLKRYIMKPYSQRQLTREKRIFNYRLSRARRIVENAFGILANRFRIFLSSINLTADTAEKVILASCVLHNYLRTKAASQYTPPGFLDTELQCGTVNVGEWRDNNSLNPIGQQGTNTYPRDAKKIRDEYCEYFNGNGKVSWQDNFI